MLTAPMAAYLQEGAAPVPTMFFWRFGVWSALMVISCMILIWRKKTILLIAYLPVLAYVVSLFLACAWVDYRYGLPVLLIGMFLPACTLLSSTDPKERR